MTAKDHAFKWALWLIAIMLVFYHGALAYYNFMPLDHWFIYYSVEPLEPVVKTGQPSVTFVSHTTLNKDVILTFNDILYRYNDENKPERYDSQDTTRLHSKIGTDRITRWPFSPGPAAPGKYCLESNIVAHLNFNINRSWRYDGCLAGQYFEVEE